MSDCRFGVSPVNYPDPACFATDFLDKDILAPDFLDQHVSHLGWSGVNGLVRHFERAIGKHICVQTCKFAF